MQHFKYEVKEDLPKLAWLARIRKDEDNVFVICGKNVERFEDFYVSGAWDGDFELAGFDTSEMFCGSGAKICDGKVLFVTPSHALARLVYYRDNRDTVISNSLPFLLAYMDFSPDRRITQYERILCSILDGPEKMEKTIPLAEGGQIHQCIVSIIAVGGEGGFEILERKPQKPFSDFQEYYSRLMQTMTALRDNADSHRRQRNQYKLITTLSSGYDSTACSAIAKKLGCDTTASLSGGQYDADCGYDVAVQLGYRDIVMREMHTYRDLKGCIDADCLADGEMATALQFCVFDDLFSDKLVFFGLRGSYWDMEPTMTEGFEMIGYFNSEADVSITENALKYGYIPIPIPTFGASVCKSVFEISKSEEMKPWSIGGKYDKPIPRRIVESEGVKRESFGQVKYGGGFSFSRDNRKRLKNRMTKDGYEDFSRYMDEKRGIPWTLRRVLALGKYVVLNFPAYFNYAASKLGISRRIVQKPVRMANPGIVADLFFWATDVMKTRYQKALSGDSKSI